jgi:TolA-binding protein
MAAADERGEVDLGDEARFWLGRSLAAQERYDEATTVLQGALAREGLSRYWRARLQLALAEQFIRQRAWDQAAAALQEGLADVGDSDIAGRASFLLGQVLEAKGDFEGAAAAYAAVEGHRPYYELLYAAQLGRALVLGLDAGRPEEALDLVRRMRRDDKHFENRAEVELAYARLIAAAGRPAEARERFEELLYGDEFAGAAIPRSDVQYYYGAFYRDDLRDFVRAAAYLDTAATGLRADPGREALVTRAALTGVRREADAFLSYARIATRLAEADSLLELGALDEAAFAARIAEIEDERRRVWEAEQRRLAVLRVQSEFEGGAVGVPGADPFEEGRDPGGDPGGAPPGLADAGFLSYRDVARLQDAFVDFQTVWGDRPLVPNWRRRDAIGGAVVSGEMTDVGATGGLTTGRSAGGPPPLELGNVPRTSAARALLLEDRAGLRYELGNVLFLSLTRPDSAAYWYNLVVDEGVGEDVAARALYALAEVRREQGRTADAEALYRRLLDTAPGSALAGPARERLGLPPLEEDDARAAAGRATAAYEAAYVAWRRGDYPDALRGFLDLAVTFGETDQAPRALVAAAEAFAEWAQQDTLDLEDGIPAALVPPALFDSVAALPDAAGAPGSAVPPAISEEQEPPEPRQEEEEPFEDERPEEGVDPDEPLFLPEDLEAEGEQPQDQPEETGGETDSTQAAGPPPGPPDGVAPAPEVEPVETPAGGLASDSLAFDGLASDRTALDSTLMTMDSTAAPALQLLDLYRLVEARYPDSPYAERARARRQALLALQGVPDEGPPAGEGETPEAPHAPPVTGLPAAPADAGLPPEIVALVPPETFGLEGAAPLNTDVGGYTWRVAGAPDALTALTLLRTYAGRGLRAAITEEQGERGAGYVLLAGQFASVADAEAVRDLLPPVDVAEPLRVVALGGLRLLDEADLRRSMAVPSEEDDSQ